MKEKYEINIYPDRYRKRKNGPDFFFFFFLNTIHSDQQQPVWSYSSQRRFHSLLNPLHSQDDVPYFVLLLWHHLDIWGPYLIHSHTLFCLTSVSQHLCCREISSTCLCSASMPCSHFKVSYFPFVLRKCFSGSIKFHLFLIGWIVACSWFSITRMSRHFHKVNNLHRDFH